MKIVVIGGSGLIGSKTVERLRKKGHEVVAASPNSGVNTITGEGLAEALAGAEVVIDLANSPVLRGQGRSGVLRDFRPQSACRGEAAGVGHHVALSVVGTERLQGSGYFRGKMAQENLIKASGIPYTIVHSTQFFEFMGAIAQSGVVGQTIRLSPAYCSRSHPMTSPMSWPTSRSRAPVNGTIEIAGPERLPSQRARRAIPERDRRPTRGDRRRSRALLRRGAERSVAHAWRQSAPRRDALRRLAQPTRRRSVVRRHPIAAQRLSSSTRQETTHDQTLPLRSGADGRLP